jgi:hypothetical protein
MSNSIAKHIERKSERSRFQVYDIKGGRLALSDSKANLDTRKKALDWIKGQPSRDKFTIIEVITGGGGKE